MGRAPVRAFLTLLVGCTAGLGHAAEFDLDIGPGFGVSWDNKFAIGAQWRLESPDINLIGKSNLDPSLCAEDSCLTLSRDNNEPNERWQAAPGGNWQIGDEANLTHDAGDITSGVIRWRSDMTVMGGDNTWGFKLGWQTFYDEIQDNLQIRHPNLITEVGPAPGEATTVRAPPNARRESGNRFEIRDAFGFFRLPYGKERELDVAIGRQQLGWGEALFAISGTLNFINPVNFNHFFRPTMDLDEALTPVGMLSLGTKFNDKWSAEAFYQLEWRPYELPSRGTLGSFIVDIGTEPENGGSLSDDSLPLPFGKTPEDPLQRQRELTPVVGLISDTSASVPRLANREPDDFGQYGVKLSLFEEDWLGGTQLSLYYANYHARLPAASFIAAQSTCAAAEGSATGMDVQPGPFPVALLGFMAACGAATDNSLDSVLGQLAGQEDPSLVGEDFDALPLDSARILLEYPEDIQVFGFGFNTTALGVNWSGELAYRPDFPFQVDLEDVFFAALQPIFPREELQLAPSSGTGGEGALLGPFATATGLPVDQLAGATFTSRRNAIPDFVTAYRGGTPGEVEPGSYVRGFEEFDYWHATGGGTMILGGDNSVLWADQMVLILEFAASYVPDLPPLEELQLDSLATTNLHFSPGVVESGDPLKLNPQQEDPDAFPSKLAWGYKVAAIWAYNDKLLDGLRIRPQAILFHDVDGITPGLGGNFQQGRKIGLLGVNFNYRNTINFSIDNFLFFGGGAGNRLSDRDFLNVAVSYQF